MVIVAHRAYSNGIDPRRENSLDAIEDCLRQGWSVEVDIRRSKDGFYLSHDASHGSQKNDAAGFCRLMREIDSPPIAVNVKELGYEQDLLYFLEEQSVIDRIFLFDMELLEDTAGRTAALFREVRPAVKLAARASDRAEPLERALHCPVTSLIWADEFDRLWMTESDVAQIKKAGKQVYAISPEIHGFSLAEARRRWAAFADWGVDGVCTDYPAELASFLGGASS